AWGADRAQVAALRIEDPYAPGGGKIKVALNVRLHAVQCFLPRYLLCEVDENGALVNRPVALYGVTCDRLTFRIPVADVEVLLIGRQDDAIGTLQLVGEQAQSAVFPGEDPAKGQFLARVLKKFWQTEGRIGEVERPVRAVDEIDGTVKALPLVLLCQYREASIA